VGRCNSYRTIQPETIEEEKDEEEEEEEEVHRVN